MITPAHGRLRLARASVLAVTTISLAALAHLVGGGALPDPGVLAVLTGVVASAALAASERRLGAWALTVGLGGGQVLLHGAFTMLATTGRDPAALGTAMLPGHHAHLALRVSGGQALHAHAAQAHAATAHTGHHHLTVAMLAAHVAATLLTALVLARGERALWLLAGWLTPVIRLVAQRPAHWPRPTLPTLVLPRPASADVALAAPRRGPPVLVCLA